MITECNKRDRHQGFFCYYSRRVALCARSLFLSFMNKIKYMYQHIHRKYLVINTPVVHLN
ncbi:hypothetical protein E0D72_11935 [Escherichia coli]|nr:hypothetical protein [Escherichia coli]EEY8842082.1 hypothetical protein [Escherichia coli]EFA4016053.1 hypothetical protein [Escherichia coli]EFA5049127.1 hypothetical protein [Escherichia coli]EFB2076044.1 hypothetical protein [Escherichia coli]